MKRQELEQIALNRAKDVLGENVAVLASTYEGNLPSIKITIDQDDGDETMTLWLNTETGEIEQEEVT